MKSASAAGAALPPGSRAESFSFVMHLICAIISATVLRAREAFLGPPLISLISHLPSPISHLTSISHLPLTISLGDG